MNHYNNTHTRCRQTDVFSPLNIVWAWDTNPTTTADYTLRLNVGITIKQHLVMFCIVVFALQLLATANYPINKHSVNYCLSKRKHREDSHLSCQHLSPPPRQGMN